MQSNDFSIHTMSREQVAIAIDWAAAEGWNPGLHDAQCFYAADPEGFLIGMLGAQPIAVISVVKYGRGFGFLGCYIVKPAYRGQGYGMQLWNAGLAYLSGRTVGLDGVLAQQSNYMKSGFRLACANRRYRGLAGGDFPASPEIVPLSSLPFSELQAYDQAIFTENRATFLRGWIAQAESTALGILQNRKLAGYAVLRKCHAGYKIGPLFADNPELAEQLLQALNASAPQGAEIYLDTPALNPAAVAMAKRHDMSLSFETARMYLGPAPPVPIERVFGISSFELG